MNERIAKLRSADARGQADDQRRAGPAHHRVLQAAGNAGPVGADAARPGFQAPHGEEGHRLQRRRAHRRRARARAQGDADLSRGLHPFPPGPALPQRPEKNGLRLRRGNAPGLRRRDHPLLAGAFAERSHLFRDDQGMDRRLRGRDLHRVHGAARPRPHRPRRQDLPEGPARFPAGHRSGAGRARFHGRPGRLRQAGRAQGHGRELRRGRRVRPPARGQGPGAGRGGDGPGPEEGAGADRRGLRPRARPRAARFLGGPPGLLVHPPRGHHRVQHLGLFQSGTPRPAPLAVLSTGTGRRQPDEGIGPGAARGLLDQVQQPARPAQGRRNR